MTTFNADGIVPLREKLCSHIDIYEVSGFYRITRSPPHTSTNGRPTVPELIFRRLSAACRHLGGATTVNMKSYRYIAIPPLVTVLESRHTLSSYND